MLNTLRRGWALFCIVPLCYYIYGYNAFMRVAGDGNYLEILQSIPVTLLVISAYAVIYIFFNQIKEQARKEGELELLRSQVTALTNHDNAIRAAWQETAFLHHAIVQAEALLRAGETEQAQELLECVPGQAGLECCCENMTLNTILSFYFNKARRAGIEVTATLDIPEVLPVDRTELACVFSNALENAIDACSNLPENAPKWLRVTCFSHPQFVMEISNPFCGEVVFDQQGFPLTKEGGRGIGTRSIAAFVRENNAIYDYEASNGVFSLRLLLKPQED